MTTLEQLYLFLKFHFAPPSEAKTEVWKSCSDSFYTDEVVENICTRLSLNSTSFTDYEIQMLRTVAEPPSFATNDVELAMRLTKSLVEYENDPEAAHVTADEFLVSLVESLGHPSVAEAYRSVNKWSA